MTKIQKLFSRINPLHWLTTGYINKINYKEYKKPVFAEFNERPVEYRFVFEQIAEFYPKNVLDVGTGLTALPSVMANCGCSVTAIDNVKDYWLNGMFNRHYHVINDDIVNTKIEKTFDMITCISTLEHIEKYDQAVKSMFSLLKNGGYLVLTFPYNEKIGVENVYSLPDSIVKNLPKYKTRVYCRDDLDRWQKQNNAIILKQEYWKFFQGDYWATGEILLPPEKVDVKDKHQISCLVFQKKLSV
jgi:2-polyprenyl-3-methyl-5-hydroxy-6-metoxy-1,4-benzoquinol methylase